jgi:hypothetical protein
MLREIVEWFFQLKGFELILWGIALLFSVLFVIQTIASFFIGGDGDADDFSADGHGDAYQFFTVRNMIVFFTMFGWAGLTAYHSGIPNVWVIVIGVSSGVLMIAILYFLMTKTKRLKHDGTLQMKNAISQIGETYLRIPAKRGGIGKVQIHVQGRLVELEAMTDDQQDIATGRPIKVVNTLNESILLVTSLN